MIHSKYDKGGDCMYYQVGEKFKVTTKGRKTFENAKEVRVYSNCIGNDTNDSSIILKSDKNTFVVTYPELKTHFSEGVLRLL